MKHKVPVIFLCSRCPPSHYYSIPTIWTSQKKILFNKQSEYIFKSENNLRNLCTQIHTHKMHVLPWHIKWCLVMNWTAVKEISLLKICKWKLKNLYHYREYFLSSYSISNFKLWQKKIKFHAIFYTSSTC